MSRVGRPESCCDVDLEAIGYDGHHAAEDLEEWHRREVEQLMRGAGYALIHDGGIRSWSVLVYRR